MNDTDILAALIAAAQRAPTAAAAASVQAALSGCPTPAALLPALDPPLVRDCPESELPLAVPEPLDDPHDIGEIDHSLDWMFAPRSRR